MVRRQLERRPATRLAGRVEAGAEAAPSNRRRKASRWLGARLRRTAALAIFEPVTFPVHLQDVDVVGEPVQ